MYAQVVVLTYQPPDSDSFTYEIPKDLDLKIGQLVEVPFGKRNPMGIVLSKDERLTTNVKNIKPISKILLDQPILQPYQIELLNWMSGFYIAATVNCLEAMLPQIPKKLDQQNKNVQPKLAQSLVLVPSINRLPETRAKFPKAKNYVVYHNEQKPKERFETWQKIAAGRADYIFTSRAGIFAPCPNLKEIIIYDEHDNAFKDERSPYYDTLTVAQKIAELTKAQLKIVDPSPRITTYFALKNHIKIQKFTQDIVLVDMQKEKLSGRHSPVSFALEEEIRKILEKKGNVFLFLNKKKESGHLFCKNCKNSQHLEKQPAYCPNCKSPDIFWNVLNTNSLSMEVKKLFPGSQIDINTALALYAPQVKKYDLAAHIQTDSLLNLADYNSSEKLFAQVTQLKKLLKETGKLYLQTYNFEHPTISALDVGNYESFYKAEISARKLVSYPPYSLLIKLTIKDKTEDKAKQQADQIATNLRSSLDLSRSTLLGPYKPTFWQRQPTYHIILKYKIADYSLKNRQKAIEAMSKYLEKGNKTYTIEVEPNSIQ